MTPPTRPVAPERLNATDATLWDIERNPSLRTTIVAVLILDRPVSRRRVVAELEATSRAIVRMRQVVVPNLGGIGAPSWVIDPDFVVDDHVGFHETDDLAAAIDVHAATMATEPFDRARPLWEARAISTRGGRSALLLKVHHSLTDGVGGLRLLDAVLATSRRTPSPDLDALPVPVAGHEERQASSRLGTVAGRLIGAELSMARWAARAALHPLASGGDAVRGAGSAGRLLAPSGAPLSPAMIARGPNRAIWTSDVDFARLRDAAGRHGCTVNHAFFAASIGAVAAYHQAIGAPAAQLRVTMPVSVRRSGDADGGNQWAPVRFVVPADIDDPVERMLTMRELVLSARRERAIGFSRSLAGVVQLLPSQISSAIVGGMVGGVDLTLTNVPGLTSARYFGGARVERLYPLAPTAGAALNIGLCSHLDVACVGALIDADAVPDRDALAEHLAAGFEDVLTAAERRPPSTTSPRVSASESLPAHAERLSALDASFLHMETDRTPMHIGGVFTLTGDALRDSSGELRIEAIRGHVEARLQSLPRFRSRLADVPFALGRPVWVDDDEFDIARHVRVIAAPAPGERQDLLDVCAEVFRHPLDRRHPLWELWIVDGLADGTIGMIDKVHHALVDGVSGVEMLSALFDLEPVHRPDRPDRPAATGHRPRTARLVADAVGERATDSVVVAARLLGAVADPARVVESIRLGAMAATELVRSAGGRHHRAPFNHTPGTLRALRAVTLDRAAVDRVRHALGATVNDLVLAAVADALGTWFERAGEERVDLHVLAPVSTRHTTMADQPGNHVGAMVVELPVCANDPLHRLDLVRERVGAAKAAHEGEGVAAVLDAADHLPPFVDSLVARLLDAQPFVDLVITNVPGIRVPVSFLGAPVVEMIPVVPLGPRLALGIAVLSYADRLVVSLFADPDEVPDLDRLAGDVAAAFEGYEAVAAEQTSGG